MFSVVTPPWEFNKIYKTGGLTWVPRPILIAAPLPSNVNTSTLYQNIFISISLVRLFTRFLWDFFSLGGLSDLGFNNENMVEFRGTWHKKVRLVYYWRAFVLSRTKLIDYRIYFPVVGCGPLSGLSLFDFSRPCCSSFFRLFIIVICFIVVPFKCQIVDLSIKQE